MQAIRIHIILTSYELIPYIFISFELADLLKSKCKYIIIKSIQITSNNKYTYPIMSKVVLLAYTL